MRILLVTNTYPPADISGVGVLAQELARELEAGGHEVCVLTRRGAGRRGAGRRGAGAEHLVVATGGPKVLFPLAAGWRLLCLGSRAGAGAEPWDLVHVHESDGVVVAALVRLARLFGRRLGTPRLLATLQVSYRRERWSVRPILADGRVVSRPTREERLFAWLRAPLLALLGRLSAHLADAVVAPSRRTAEELEADYGARVVAVIPNGVAALPAADGATEGGAEAARDLPSPVVLYVGRLRTRKAVAVLLEAFARLRRAVPTATLVVAGDGEHRRNLEAQARALDLGPGLRFLGAVPRHHLAAWYDAADIFCLPSLYEGFPVAILEAMTAGLPVVSTTVSGIPEAVTDGVTGLLVAPEDAAALAAALERLAGDEDLRRRMGEAGRRAVGEHFSIAVVCAAYLDLMRRLVAERE